jgi:hypothetical protein
MLQRRLRLSFLVILLFITISFVQAEKRTAPTTQPAGIAARIFRQAQAKYIAMDSFCCTGETVSEITTSGAEPIKSPGAKMEKKKALRESLQFGKPQKATSTFSLRLSKPDFYLIEWRQKVNPQSTEDGAVWSAGEGNFLWTSRDGKPRKQKDRNTALAMAAGDSFDVAATIPYIFYDEGANVLRVLGTPAMMSDEKIDGDDCYVISGTLGNRKTLLWISMKTFLIRQIRDILGQRPDNRLPAISDDMIKEMLKLRGQKPTAQAISRMKKEMQSASNISAGMKGTTTQTYRNIVINGPIVRSHYKPKRFAVKTTPTSRPGK